MFSFDSAALIEELKSDIAVEGVKTVWAYWVVMPNGQELYVDYFYVDDEFPIRRFGPSLKDFDLKMAEEFNSFNRKKMPATELLELLEKEDETL
ncbi:hypothetical protein lacNasYZ03_10570 [Lactobacillus nasalidis]|uniref:Uncharacterized protein n=1 Tax=Lactobacillus nasalidis TaxID=2797258 RepID=A0ABQ3W4D0_9LACO|nr:hypothetical protein [Lactobacillus nasalidis]GHV97762.1 hypothetical protein lacNasYZ01_09440 [Lactobacillus nasalidis]GHW00233.1 hypothetical protein lacNasYZ02_16620 [Lactobacillus nasalidis]GHW01370.1 hypothetical protein lacNasYZ03_10570 [Lactobacillus nasalidis]